MNFIIPLIVYPLDLMVSLGQSDVQLKASLKAFTFKWDEKMIIKGNGLFVMGPGNESLIRTRFYPKTPFDFGTLHHEIFHAVTHILDVTGHKMKLGTSDESYAYLTGFITTEIYRKIRR